MVALTLTPQLALVRCYQKQIVLLERILNVFDQSPPEPSDYTREGFEIACDVRAHHVQVLEDVLQDLRDILTAVQL